MDSKCGRTATKRPHWKGFEVGRTAFSGRDSRDMDPNCRIRAIFPYRDRNRNRDRNRILNPWTVVLFYYYNTLVLIQTKCMQHGKWPRCHDRRNPTLGYIVLAQESKCDTGVAVPNLSVAFTRKVQFRQRKLRSHSTLVEVKMILKWKRDKT